MHSTHVRSRGFTLVELLVVIGIIALLVGILLPALQSARKQAAGVKCASALREVGNAFNFYAIESRGFFPPALLQPASGRIYNLDGTAYNSSLWPYWYNWLTKFVTKSAVGNAATTPIVAEDGRRSIFWACPEWQGYQSSTAITGTNLVQVGYGMNIWPEFTPNLTLASGGFPPALVRPSSVGPTAPFNNRPLRAFIENWNEPRGSQTGNFVKQRVYAIGGASNRVLVGDSRFWALESNPMPANGVFPPQPNINNSETYTPGVAGQTMVDVYRHGKFPRLNDTPARTFAQRGGKVGYNLLWVDGRVTSENTQENAYRGLRMRFPG